MTNKKIIKSKNDIKKVSPLKKEDKFIHPLNDILKTFSYEEKELIITKISFNLGFINIFTSKFEIIKNLFKICRLEYVKIWNLYINKIEVKKDG
jgi:hypothetical protein